MTTEIPTIDIILNKIYDRASLTSVEDLKQKRARAEKYKLTIDIVGSGEKKKTLHPAFAGYNNYKGKYILLHLTDFPQIIIDDIEGALITLQERKIIVGWCPITNEYGQKLFEVDLPDNFTKIVTHEDEQKDSLFEVKESDVYYKKQGPVSLAPMEKKVLKCLIKNFNKLVPYSKIKNIISDPKSPATHKDVMNAVGRLNQKLKNGFKLIHKPIENRPENKNNEGAYTLLN